MPNITSKFETNLSKHIKPNSHLILGISGGVDSMVMLEILSKLAPKHKLHLHIAHLNHGIRSDSGLDQKLVTNTATKLQIPIHTKTVKLQKSAGSLEAQGRQIRYQFFHQIAQELKPATTWILTAHHLNDSLESFFLNLKRGCHFQGLIGIQLKNNNLIRPLFNITKNSIHQYAIKNNIKFHEDSTNQDTTFQRNFIRHKLIPPFQNKSPELIKNFHQHQSYWQQKVENQQEFAKNWLQKNSNPSEFNLPKSQFVQLSPTAQKNILTYIYQQLYQYNHNLSRAQITKMITTIHQNSPNLKSEFGPKHWLQTTYNQVKVITKNSPSKNSSPPTLCPKSGKVTFNNFQITTQIIAPPSLTQIKNSSAIFLDYQQITPPLLIRTWQPGDKIKLLNNQGSQKLQDFFTNQKIPTPIRHTIPLFVNNKTIAAIGNLSINNHFKITPQTRSALKITITEI